MQAYDIIMIIVLLGATVWGYRKGLAWQIASIASLFLSYTVAMRFRDVLAPQLSFDPPWNTFLSMLILFIGTSLVIWILFRLIRGALDQAKLKEFDHHLGAIFGFAKGIVLSVIITLFAVTLLGETQRQAIIDSHSGYFIAHLLDRSTVIIPDEIHRVLEPYLHDFDHHLEEDQMYADDPDWVDPSSFHEMEDDFQPPELEWPSDNDSGDIAWPIPEEWDADDYEQRADRVDNSRRY